MPSILKTTQIQEPSSASVNLTLDTSGNGTFAGTSVMSSPYTMRNKIINGAMVIDQRNAGAAVTANNSYPVDRFFVGYSTSGAVSSQQSSSIYPSGFTYSTGITVTTADSALGATDYVFAEQRIEGYNAADLAFGSASAATITLSFRVRSSLTGTYCIALLNGAGDRSYVAEYTISAANTWETKTITVVGDTTGTWLTTNGIGLRVRFALMAGSSFQQSAGSWGTANAIGTSNQVNWMATLSNTFYITGVQLERGTVATPFEYRNYQQELAMCQRYFQKSYDIETAVGTASYNGYINWNWQNLSNYGTVNIILPVRMRAAPTCTNYNPALTNTVGGRYWNGTAEVAFTGSMAGWDQYQSTIRFNKDATNSTNILIQWTASAEL